MNTIVKKNKPKLAKSEKKNKKKINIKWVIIITIIAFIISLFFSFLTETIMPKVNLTIAIFLVIIFISLGIIFDMIGIAITSALETPFHSMSAQKVRGASIAVKLKKNASQMSSFCNDVIGDICGIISGSAGIYLSLKLSALTNINPFTITLIITSLIASLTIGGKALGKSLAINNSTLILYQFAKFISYFHVFR